MEGETWLWVLHAHPPGIDQMSFWGLPHRHPHRARGPTGHLLHTDPPSSKPAPLSRVIPSTPPPYSLPHSLSLSPRFAMGLLPMKPILLPGLGSNLCGSLSCPGLRVLVQHPLLFTAAATYSTFWGSSPCPQSLPPSGAPAPCFLVTSSQACKATSPF